MNHLIFGLMQISSPGYYLTWIFPSGKNCHAVVIPGFKCDSFLWIKVHFLLFEGPAGGGCFLDFLFFYGSAIAVPAVVFPTQLFFVSINAGLILMPLIFFQSPKH